MNNLISTLYYLLMFDENYFVKKQFGVNFLKILRKSFDRIGSIKMTIMVK
jgi:hypothetical protein